MEDLRNDRRCTLYTPGPTEWQGLLGYKRVQVTRDWIAKAVTDSDLVGALYADHKSGLGSVCMSANDIDELSESVKSRKKCRTSDRIE